jgi:hypothetical protein
MRDRGGADQMVRERAWQYKAAVTGRLQWLHCASELCSGKLASNNLTPAQWLRVPGCMSHACLGLSLKPSLSRCSCHTCSAQPHSPSHSLVLLLLGMYPSLHGKTVQQRDRCGPGCDTVYHDWGNCTHCMEGPNVHKPPDAYQQVQLTPPGTGVQSALTQPPLLLVQLPVRTAGVAGRRAGRQQTQRGSLWLTRVCCVVAVEAIRLQVASCHKC